jgi:hypothetical protein
MGHTSNRSLFDVIGGVGSMVLDRVLLDAVEVGHTVIIGSEDDIEGHCRNIGNDLG